jgi:hypothetical protein
MEKAKANWHEKISWNVEEHKQEDIKTSGGCFNHIIGLPQKDVIDKPLYYF